jgi:hypothetical protein
MKRAVALAAVAVAALAPAGAAEAAPQKTARFVAYVSGKQVTTWNMPRYATYRDCQGQRYTEGEGREVVTFRSEKPTRLLVYKNGAYGPFVRYGTWSRFGQSTAIGIQATGKADRTGRVVHSLEPSVCHDAGDPTSEDTGPYDCGSRPYSPAVGLDWRGNRLTLATLDLFPEPFQNCPLNVPAGVDGQDITKISERYPARDLFDRSQGLVVVLGRQTFTGKFQSDHGTTTTTVTWKLRLRRAR